VLRDPRAVISSMLHTTFFDFAKSLEDAVKQYRDCLYAMTPFLGHPSVMTLRYEELVRRTPDLLADVLSFCDLEGSSVSDLIADNHRRSKGDLEGTFRRGLVDGYREELSHGEIRYVEGALEALMALFGYPPMLTRVREATP